MAHSSMMNKESSSSKKEAPKMDTFLTDKSCIRIMFSLVQMINEDGRMSQ
jgi:hypothetical protein